MKQRLIGFLSEENISHDSEIFDYIRELHDYLWRFVRVEFGQGTSGHLDMLIDNVIESAERKQKIGLYK